MDGRGGAGQAVDLVLTSLRLSRFLLWLPPGWGTAAMAAPATGRWWPGLAFLLLSFAAGIQASLDLANSGMKVYLVENGISIGGVMAQLDKTFPTNDCSACILSPKLVEVGRHPNVTIMTRRTVEAVEGEPGKFRIKLTSAPRYVNLDKCTGCGICAKACPVEVITMQVTAAVP